MWQLVYELLAGEAMPGPTAVGMGAGLTVDSRCNATLDLPFLVCGCEMATEEQKT